MTECLGVRAREREREREREIEREREMDEASVIFELLLFFRSKNLKHESLETLDPEAKIPLKIPRSLKGGRWIYANKNWI